MKVLEIARFALADGCTGAELHTAWTASHGFVSAQPGFLSRRLVEGDNGEWLDLVEWTDLAAAQAAKASFDPQAHPELMGLMQAVDPQRFSMTHHPILDERG